MGVKEDISRLKYKQDIPRMFADSKFHINSTHYSNTTKNVISTMFVPYSSHLCQKFYRLDDEEIKIVIDILELMEGLEYEN